MAVDELVRQESRAEPDDSWNKGGIGAVASARALQSASFLLLGSHMPFAVSLHLLGVRG
jgi:hypothetical protein